MKRGYYYQPFRNKKKNKQLYTNKRDIPDQTYRFPKRHKRLVMD